MALNFILNRMIFERTVHLSKNQINVIYYKTDIL